MHKIDSGFFFFYYAYKQTKMTIIAYNYVTKLQTYLCKIW